MGVQLEVQKCREGWWWFWSDICGHGIKRAGLGMFFGGRVNKTCYKIESGSWEGKKINQG